MADITGGAEFTSLGEREPTRRDFINILAVTSTIGAAAAFAWPLIDQMNPAADAIAQGLPVTVDLAKVAPGQMITILWRKMPIFIVHRTPAMLAELTKSGDLDQLKDPNSSARQQPKYAANWCRSSNPEFLVLVGVCTHLGCTPGFQPGLGSLGPTWPGGWLCACHGSRYDLAGRVMKGSPAPMNLPVPPCNFTPGNQVVIGENPPSGSFEMSEVETL